MRSDRYSKILVGAMALALVACMDDPTANTSSFYATLSGAQEVPAVSTTASGTGTCAPTAAGFTCTINYSGLSGAPTAAHIHQGAAGVASGTVRVDLCGTAASPACPTGTSGTITATNQPVNAGSSFTSVRSAMFTYGTYVNVHTAANTGGEIRGHLLGAQ